MDNSEHQLRNILLLLNSEDTPKDFYTKVYKKIEERKVYKEKRREAIQQFLVVFLLSILFLGCLIYLNKLYFQIELYSLVIRTKTTLYHMIDIFHSNYVSQWAIIGINAVILILLEQLLSKKLSKKL